MNLTSVLRGARLREHATTRLREHAAISALYIVSRSVLDWMGIPFNFDLRWMFLADPQDLKSKLLETVYYFHAYPPGTNLVTGAVLKVGGAHAPVLAHAVMQSMGLVLINSFFYLCRVSGASLAVAASVSVALSLIPASIYFEHLYLYACPVAALLCLSAALFHRAIERRTFGTWFALFATCAIIGWIRSTFHLAWFGAVLALGIWLSERADRRRVLAAACGPAFFVAALYFKNLAVFGVFGATTFGPANLTTVTVARLPEETRNAWVKDGKLSPFASISVFDGPREYLSSFGSSDDPRWPPSMNLLERPTIGVPNYNHWVFLDVNRTRRADALIYLKERPFAYAATVGQNLAGFFAPSTEWHPHDDKPTSPHHQHRLVLGPYEKAYKAAFHSLPFAPLGIYAFLPLAAGWAFLRARKLVRETSAEGIARGSLLYYCLFQIGFVLAASSLFTFAETARYRYDVESMIWLLGALSLAALGRRVSRALRSR